MNESVKDRTGTEKGCVGPAPAARLTRSFIRPRRSAQRLGDLLSLIDRDRLGRPCAQLAILVTHDLGEEALPLYLINI